MVISYFNLTDIYNILQIKTTHNPRRVISHLKKILDILLIVDAIAVVGFVGLTIFGISVMGTKTDAKYFEKQKISITESNQKRILYSYGLDTLNWEDYVVTNEKYFRPNEVGFLLGDSSKAKKELGWEPKTSFDKLVEMMVESDIENAKQEKVLLENNLIMPTWEYPTP